MKKLKVVCISDTHNLHDYLNLPSGDILVHAGDATGRGTVAEITELNRFFGSVKHKFKHIIFVAGNHDWLFQRDKEEAVKILTNATYLEDEMIEIEGRKIYGSPWQPEFYNWAFNLPRGAKIKEKWDLIPYDLDLLITHGPPHGFCDTLRKFGPFEDSQGNPKMGEFMVHLGCEDLANAVIEKEPKNHVFGHIHDGYGQLQVGKTLFSNVSTCNEQYRPVNPVIVIEL